MSSAIKKMLVVSAVPVVSKKKT